MDQKNALLKEEENVTKYEFVRKNVLSATMHFNKRVQEFIKTIVMAKAEFHKMPVTYYNYRVEFQQRGNTAIREAVIYVLADFVR